MPVVAALAGHSPAGGAVLAAHCDYRVAADGTFKIGFNEVRVGLPLPASILHVFSDLVGTRLARQSSMQGQLMLMDSALEIGLIDEVVAQELVEKRAVEFLTGLLALPTVAMNTTRMSGKKEMIRQLDASDDVEKTTAAWFADETQAALQQLADSLSKSN